MSQQQTTPLISVIIPVFNDSERLQKCLTALQGQQIDEPFEVIVSDNGSTENISSIVGRFAFAKYISHPEGGSYAARNAALKVAQGEVLAFTDSDCIPADDWLSQGMKALEQNPKSFIGGNIELFALNPDKPTSAELWELAHALQQQRYVDDEKFAATANVLVRRADFDQVGEFNGTMKSSGDREWGNRANAAGITGIFEPSVVVRHPARHTLGEITRKMKRMHGGSTQLKLERGENPLPARELLVLVKPPARSLKRGMERIQPQTPRVRAKYAFASYYLAYARPLIKLRLEIARRAGRAHSVR